jgi:hypothetical protein
VSGEYALSYPPHVSQNIFRRFAALPIQDHPPGDELGGGMPAEPPALGPIIEHCPSRSGYISAMAAFLQSFDPQISAAPRKAASDSA